MSFWLIADFCWRERDTFDRIMINCRVMLESLVATFRRTAQGDVPTNSRGWCSNEQQRVMFRRTVEGVVRTNSGGRCSTTLLNFAVPCRFKIWPKFYCFINTLPQNIYSNMTKIEQMEKKFVEHIQLICLSTMLFRLPPPTPAPFSHTSSLLQLRLPHPTPAPSSHSLCSYWPVIICMGSGVFKPIAGNRRIFWRLIWSHIQPLKQYLIDGLIKRDKGLTIRE